VRYGQSILGGFWLLMQPLLAMVILSVFLGHLAGGASDPLSYPIFCFTALLP